jgi:hypothetical protein
MTDALTYDYFGALAGRGACDRDSWAELYPMVRDLLALADMVSGLAPELHQEIPVEAFTIGMSEGLR